MSSCSSRVQILASVWSDLGDLWTPAALVLHRLWRTVSLTLSYWPSSRLSCLFCFAVTVITKLSASPPPNLPVKQYKTHRYLFFLRDRKKPIATLCRYQRPCPSRTTGLISTLGASPPSSARQKRKATRPKIISVHISRQTEAPHSKLWMWQFSRSREFYLHSDQGRQRPFDLHMYSPHFRD